MNSFEFRGVKKRLGSFNLESISFALPRGCIMSLIGKNGGGKTTLIKLLLGQLSPDEGEILIFGEKIDKKHAVYEEIGVVADKNVFHESMNLRDLNKIFSRCFKTWDKSEFFSLAERFRLPHNLKIGEYSQGMQVKLRTASALAHNTRLLVMDEPLNGLDPTARTELLDLLQEYVQDESRSVLISSHILSGLEQITDCVTLIDTGRIIFSDYKENLLDKYKIAKCTREQLSRIPSEYILNVHESAFSAEALIYASAPLSGFITQTPTIEEIMVHLTSRRQSFEL